MKRHCNWILTTRGGDRFKCGRPTSYRMVDDGGEPGAAKVRKYNAFCDEHQAAADAEDDE